MSNISHQPVFDFLVNPSLASLGLCLVACTSGTITVSGHFSEITNLIPLSLTPASWFSSLQTASAQAPWWWRRRCPPSETCSRGSASRRTTRRRPRAARPARRNGWRRGRASGKQATEIDPNWTSLLQKTSNLEPDVWHQGLQLNLTAESTRPPSLNQREIGGNRPVVLAKLRRAHCNYSSTSLLTRAPAPIS